MAEQIGILFPRRIFAGDLLSNREISLSMSLSVETIKEYVQKILRKLDVSDRTAAAVWALRQGLVT